MLQEKVDVDGKIGSSWWMSRVPERYRKQFDDARLETNLRRMSLLAIYVVVLQIVLNIINLMIPSDTQTSLIAYYVALSLFSLMMGCIYCVLFRMVRRGGLVRRDIKVFLVQSLLYLYISLQLIFCTLNFLSSGGINSYIIAILILSMLPILPPIQSILTTLFCLAYVLVIAYLLRGTSVAWNSIVVSDTWTNLIIITGLALCASLLIYEMYVANFLKNIELQHINDGLESAVKQRTLELKRQTEMARSASEAKSQFLAKMSHEIRTPMNAIVGMAELISRETLTPAAQEYAHNIKQAGSNLVAIINDILDISKIESGKLEIVPADYLFSSMVHDIITIMRMRIGEKQILFTVNIDSRIPQNLVGDEIRVRQIILNLLSNAYKYCETGFISLDISEQQRNDQDVFLEIRVTDSGIGIKEENISKLFDDFVQIDLQKNKGVEGTGLGLAITKSLCVQMRGSISVESEYGKGSCFCVRVPQKYVSNHRLAQVADAEHKSVLLYESRERYADSILRTLKDLGIAAVWASDQSQFSEALRKREYSFIFTPSFLLESARSTLALVGGDFEVVVLAELEEHLVSSHIKTIPMPAHAISIANILNDAGETVYCDDDPRCLVRFVAPTARVLVVDDIETNLKVANGLMLPYNMQIDLCSGGAEAIRLVQKNRYDLIFMDHMMPLMDGVETTLRLRALSSEDGYFQKIPIIALTANAVSGVKEMFLKNGFDDFLPKPIETSKLAAILNQWIPDKKKREPLSETPEHSHVDLYIEGLDVALGISMTGGTLKGYLNTLSVFLRDGEKKIAEIQECVTRGDLPLYAIYVHALKSALGSIGGKELSDFAQALEFAGKNQDFIFVQEHTQDFLTRLEMLLLEIRKHSVAQNPEIVVTATQAEDALSVAKLLELRDAVEKMDANQSDDLLGQLRQTAHTAEARERLDAIEKQLLLCEQEAAVVLIDMLLNDEP